ncbi:hypothetical protein A0O28_0110920 [Trichoderma guizhouense]|uniref:Uncharacterized protein n=1 Tax=Trichoderma guizhouense TaxID=1491466 RepID=A0A1T3CQ59_9HYPO|nr:hypothetical protein A0O28_0110920 [Trichoderma guizhouense]
MATSMGPNFAGHPAMGHPGVAGHPMGGPGMPPNAGQQGAPAGMPHQFAGGHIAVSGPGGPVNPALMGAIPPGASPGPHAVHQLSPAQQQQMFQQQQHLQQQFNINNPSAQMAAIRQQQLLHQQQRQQAMFAQQFQNMNAAGVNSMPMGMQLSPQQLHQLRQRNAAAGLGHVGQHNPQAAIMAQQLALQQHAAQQQAAQQAQQQAAQQQAQQQAAHNQQMSANHSQAQHMAMNAQSMPGMPQQNPMAAGAQTQMGAQQQQTPQQQPGQPQPQPQQQPGPQSQPTPQQTSQAGTPAPSGQQTPSQTPAPTPAHANQIPPGQAQPQQAQAPNQAQMAAAATQQLMANSMMQQQLREGMKTRCLLKLMQFGERLSGFPGAKSKDDLSYWNRFVAQFFSSPNGVFRFSLHVGESEDSPDKQYEIAYPAIARFFHTNYSSGVKSMQLILDSGSSDRPLPGDCYCIENPRASFVYWYETGSHLVATGTLRAQFDAEQKIELFEFLTTKHEEYVARKHVIEAAKPAHEWVKEWRSLNTMDGKQSPEMSKKGKSRQLKSPQKEPPGVLVDLPDSAVNSKGVTEAVHQFLEIVEVMGQMNPLFGFYHSNPGLSPYAALEQYVATQINSATPIMNGQAMAQGPRTPSFGQFPMGASPAAVHMNLPGSPHIGSPAPGQAPGMQLQPSQQGTSSSGPSANTSPASNKRRRPSTVKVEDDSATPGTGQVNGIQGRGKPQTPRMAKRMKGSAT